MKVVPRRRGHAEGPLRPSDESDLPHLENS